MLGDFGFIIRGYLILPADDDESAFVAMASFLGAGCDYELLVFQTRLVYVL